MLYNINYELACNDQFRIIISYHKHILCKPLLNGLTLIGLNLRGGDLSFLASRDLFLTTLEWIAQETQYNNLA